MGLALVEIAKTLQDRGVDYLAVAVADEGAELRRAGRTGIIVMNPEMSAFHTLFEYDLEPEDCRFFGDLKARHHVQKKKVYRASPSTSSSTRECTAWALIR